MEESNPFINFPTQITVGQVTYTVTYDTESYNAMAVEQNGQAEGFCRPKDGIIVICPDQCEDQIVDTLAHEVEHAILAFVGVSPGAAEEFSQEEWISRTNSVRIDTYRRNPVLRRAVFGA